MRPRRVEGIIAAELADDESVVSTPDAREAVILNPMGASVFDLCDGTRTVDDIVGFICDHVAGAEPDRVRGDVDALLARLLEAGIVEDAAGG